MKRRQFTRLTSVAAAGAWLRETSPLRFAYSTRQTGRPERLSADPQRLGERIQTLATFGANEAGGIDRVAFSDANIEALDWCAGHLRSADFRVERDLVGNLVARKVGSDTSLNPIMFGSHIDSVPGGGNYDGQVGSMGAMEIATVLADAGHMTRHPLELVFFTNEEGGKTGSRALVGEVAPFELDIEELSIENPPILP